MSWDDKLDWVKKYIDENEKKPYILDDNKEIKSFGYWINDQHKRYQNNNYIMKNIEYRNKWYNFIECDKYKKYFILNLDIWKNKLNDIKKYIDINKNRPSEIDKNNKIKLLGKWLSHQQQYYKNKTRLMKNIEIYDYWSSFINDPTYKKYFISNIDIWNNKLEIIKKYIYLNKELPSKINKNIEIKSHGIWISQQKQNYKNISHTMTINEIYNKWTLFINNPIYKKYFISNIDQWINTLDNIKKYIVVNKKRPSASSKNSEIKIYGIWISSQQQKYKKKSQIMKNNKIYKMWNEFINDPIYKKYF